MSKCRHTNNQNQKLSVAAFQLVDGDLTDLLVGVGAVKGTGRLVALARVEESLLRRLGYVCSSDDAEQEEEDGDDDDDDDDEDHGAECASDAHGDSVEDSAHDGDDADDDGD